MLEYRDCVLRSSVYLLQFPDKIYQQAANTTGSTCIHLASEDPFRIDRADIAEEARRYLQQHHKSWAELVNRAPQKNPIRFVSNVTWDQQHFNKRRYTKSMQPIFMPSVLFIFLHLILTWDQMLKETCCWAQITQSLTYGPSKLESVCSPSTILAEISIMSTFAFIHT